MTVLTNTVYIAKNKKRGIRVNKWVGIGRLTSDPELRFTNNGKPVANFTLAIDRPYKNANGEKEADFIKIVAWNKLGEVCSNNLKKGRLVCVEGSLQIRSYQADDGQKRYVTEIKADEVHFLDKPKED